MIELEAADKVLSGRSVVVCKRKSLAWTGQEGAAEVGPTLPELNWIPVRIWGQIVGPSGLEFKFELSSWLAVGTQSRPMRFD